VTLLAAGTVPITFLAFSSNSVATEAIAGWNINQGSKEFIAGSFAGFMSVFIITPTELIKCRRQVDHSIVKYREGANWTVFKNIWKTHGFFGYWRGLSITLLRDCPTTGIWFFTYRRLCYLLSDSEEQLLTNTLPVWKVGLAGAIAGVANWTVSYPFEVVKTVVQTTPHVTARHIFATNWRLSGLKFFTRGYTACMLRAIPTNAMMFIGYDKIKWLLNK
jgi:hypothetical protein